MKTINRFLCILFLTFFTSSSVFSNQKEFIDKNDPQHIDKILATNPSTISKEQFYECEFAIISGFSGSGGNYLEEPEIEWLRKADNSFKARGIKLKDKYHRNFVIADSYFNNGMYEKALEEFKNIKNQAGIELAEWFISNKGIKNGIVKIKEYPDRIPWKSSEITKAENKQYLFVAYFKGPVYKYDKKRKMHALIYAPLSQYDWCDALTFNGNNLLIKLRDNAGTFIFDNEKQRISQLAEAFNVDISEIIVFFGPDFYELSPIIDNLKLSCFYLRRHYKNKEVEKYIEETMKINEMEKFISKSFLSFDMAKDSELVKEVEDFLKASGIIKGYLITYDRGIEASAHTEHPLFNIEIKSLKALGNLAEKIKLPLEQHYHRMHKYLSLKRDKYNLYIYSRYK